MSMYLVRVIPFASQCLPFCESCVHILQSHDQLRLMSVSGSSDCAYHVCNLSLCYVGETPSSRSWELLGIIAITFWTLSAAIPFHTNTLHSWWLCDWSFPSSDHQHTSAYVSIRQHTSVESAEYRLAHFVSNARSCFRGILFVFLHIQMCICLASSNILWVYYVMFPGHRHYTHTHALAVAPCSVSINNSVPWFSYFLLLNTPSSTHSFAAQNDSHWDSEQTLRQRSAFRSTLENVGGKGEREAADWHKGARCHGRAACALPHAQRCKCSQRRQCRYCSSVCAANKTESYTECFQGNRGRRAALLCYIRISQGWHLSKRVHRPRMICRTQTHVSRICSAAGHSLDAIGSQIPGQGGLQECCRSAERLLASILAAWASELSGEGGSKLRGVVKPLVFFWTLNTFALS